MGHVTAEPELRGEVKGLTSESKEKNWDPSNSQPLPCEEEKERKRREKKYNFENSEKTRMWS